MRKFQIAETAGEKPHAGSKATEDIIKITSRLGFEPLYIRMNDEKEGAIHKADRQIEFYKDWKKAYQRIENDSIVLLQHPFHHSQLTRNKTLTDLKNKKHVKFICLIHDIEKLRGYRYNEYYQKEFDFMLSIANVFIVHNNAMKRYMMSLGMPENRLITLDIFDYLQDKPSLALPSFNKSISIAGNLDAEKSGYIKQLKEIENIHIYLYGPNYDNTYGGPNIDYGGVFLPEQIPEKLTKGFGLVWDGTSIDSCSGESGEYLKYNNPHKLSLYLSSNLPVVIWSEAAEAKFVEDNKVGICINSLRNLGIRFGDIHAGDYDRMVFNASEISQKLRNGYYTENAISKALKIVEEE